MGRKKKEFKISEDDLCYQEPIEHIEFEDYVPSINENTVACFNFSSDINASQSFDTRNNIIEEIPLIDGHLCNNYPLQAATVINDEKLDTRRSYNLRKSTIHKLNILKADCPECNLYISTIVDNAICFYYDSIRNSKNDY